MNGLGFLVVVVAVFAAIPALIAFGVVWMTKTGDQARLDEISRSCALSISPEASRGAYIKAALGALGLFLILGPPIGAAPFALLLATTQTGSGIGWMLGSIVGGYFFGLLPAFATAVALIVFGGLHIRKRRQLPSRSKLAGQGGILGLLVSLAMLFALSNDGAVPFAVMGMFAGAICGALCFSIARRILPPECT